MDIERVGAFYLGREVDPDSGEVTEQPVLYDANDLTTHAVIVGMTGSGKTGLGVDLIEEAALDGVPVLALDPKGDLGNLALTFPDLAPSDFEPWIDPIAAERDGRSVAEAAVRQAETWREGLASWGQGPERIARLRAAAEVRLYTPGSSAGRSVSVLRSFAAPPPAVLADADLLADRLDSTVTGLLTLLGIDADPLTSREHILLATLLEHAWRAGHDLDLPALLNAIQDPPVTKLGAMDLDAVYPPQDRMRLALQLNNLIAAPGFEAWTRGDPLDLQELLYGPDGRPRVAVLSIAHLSDAERMFFTSLLLTEVVAWMRTQPGTPSLRALVYIDELFGFMPPVAEPPSKRPLLTLLKQARAFGVGLALSTQNPVDLDYKGLSNAGTWFIGRLQTERDKARVVEGLRAAAPGAPDAAELETTIGGLGKRTFLLHNVHDAMPLLFQTRWAMSYLAGPLTRDQIRALSGAGDGDAAAPAAGRAAGAAPAGGATTARPVLPPDLPQLFAPLGSEPGGDAPVTYLPFVLGVADVRYDSKTHGVDVTRRVARLVEPVEGPVPVEWGEGGATELDLNAMETRPHDGSAFQDLPDVPLDAAAARAWGKLFTAYLRGAALELWRSKEADLVSEPGESERDFRVRCLHAAREARDGRREDLRKRYASRMETLERRLLRANQTVEREAQQAQQKKLDAAISVGTALLGSFLGRRTPSASRLGTAMRSVSRLPKESGDVARAQEAAAATTRELEELQAQLEKELQELALGSAEDVELERVTIRATSTDIQQRFVGLLWLPYRRSTEGAWLAAGPVAGD